MDSSLPMPRQGQILIIKPSSPLHSHYLHTVQVKRSGIIPYVLDQNGKLWLCLGTKYNNRLTDFGGSCNDEETVYSCGIREFTEETSNAITPPKDEELMIFLLGTEDLPLATLMYNYQHNYTKDMPVFVPNDEIRAIEWYPPKRVFGKHKYYKERYGMGLSVFLHHIQQSQLVKNLRYP